MKDRRTEEWTRAGALIGDEVDPGRIAEDAVFHPGCRIRGEETSIGPGCIIGAEAPATIDNCQLGRQVELKGGYFSGAAFFDGANMGSGAHVRAGTILEEEANGAHTVGLKQTVLLPFVTLGSLINFCDILMSGGTDRRNHSEVGSSYIHFNYTPHQDKATASLVGEVSQGVFLDNDPIFLGGQGGLVGPARIAYGSIVAAGGICRADIEDGNRLHIPSSPEPDTRPYDTGIYRNVDRIVRNNLSYIGNLFALKAWYRSVRQTFMCRDSFDRACLEGGLKNIDLILAERIRRLGELAQKMKYSCDRLTVRTDASETAIASQQMFYNSWETMEFELTQSGWTADEAARDTFLAAMDNMPVGGSYVEIIRSIDPNTRGAGQRWLGSIINAVSGLWPVG